MNKLILKSSIFGFLFLFIVLCFQGGYTYAQIVNPSNNVEVNWMTPTIQKKSNGTYTYSIKSSGPATRSNVTAVYLNVSKSSIQNPQDITYQTLCTFADWQGPFFDVSYPACAGSQDTFSAQYGFNYKAYFSDGVNSSKVINSSDKTLKLPSIPAPEKEGQEGTDTPPGQSGSDTPEGVPGMSIKLDNPLGTTDSIPMLIKRLLDVVLTIGVPLIALAIIYAGFQLVTAQGNTEKLKVAKRNLVYVVIGAGILLAAYAISEVIVGTVTAIR